jgi:hypothetical protein
MEDEVHHEDTKDTNAEAAGSGRRKQSGRAALRSGQLWQRGASRGKVGGGEMMMSCRSRIQS